ncbi:MAG TPA: Clp protease N-terminal domain-containing protein [Oculatellaceae cyanobacterium]
MFKQYTTPAKIAQLAAMEETFVLCDSECDAEHILLGLCTVGVASKILATHGLSIKKVRQTVSKLKVDKPTLTVVEKVKYKFLSFTAQKPPWTVQGQRVLNLANQFCSSRSTGTQHLLLGLLSLDEGIVSGVFHAHKIDSEELKRQLIQAVEE